MAYQFFDIKRLRNDIALYAGVYSYRVIESRTNGQIKKSKAQRLATGGSQLTICDAQILMDLFDKCYDDYIVIHMI